MTVDVDELAARLDTAVRSATAIPQLSAEQPLTLQEAYAVQAAGVSLREDRGDRVAGVKLGFTSRAKAEQMGVSDVIIGVIHQGMAVADGGAVDVTTMVHPRIEPEVAFRLGSGIDPQVDPDDDGDILAAADVVLTVDGDEAARGSSADILGDPVRALGAVKRMAREHGLDHPRRRGHRGRPAGRRGHRDRRPGRPRPGHRDHRG